MIASRLFVYVYVHHAILSIYYTFIYSGVLWTRTGKYGLHLLIHFYFHLFHFPKQQLGSQIWYFYWKLFQLTFVRGENFVGGCVRVGL